MTRQRYSATESLNRILRRLEGKPLPTDVPNTVTGEILSEAEALSDIAELLAGSLPNESASLPASVIRYGKMYFDPAVDLVVDVLASGTYVQIASGSAAGPLSGFTFQNSRELKCNLAGTYLVHWQMSCHTAGVAQMEGTLMINGSGQSKALAYSASLGSAIPTSLSGNGIFTLAVNDTLSMALRNLTDAADITVRHLNMSVVLVGVQ